MKQRRKGYNRIYEMEEQFDATPSIELQETQNTYKTSHVAGFLQEKMNGITSSSADWESSWSIFRFPRPLKNISRTAWQPEMAIIGPYHRNNNSLSSKIIEGQKVQYLKSIISRIEKKEARGLNKLVDTIKELVEVARLCYSEPHREIGDAAFVEMLILDGCFLIELFLRTAKYCEEKYMDVDPIFKMPWVMPVLLRDLLKLENQIPFFVLQCLFDLSRLQTEVGVSLNQLAVKFFNQGLESSKYVLPESEKGEFQHLLDLFLSCFTSQFHATRYEHSLQLQTLPPVQMIQCVRKLRDSKVKFRPKKTDKSNFLDITFKSRCFYGVLEIPPLVIDDFTSCVFLNAIAFEQCHRFGSRHITSYAAFIDCLIDTPADVGFLYEDKIITRISGNEQNVADFFNALGKAVVLDPNNCYLSEQFQMVDKYYRSRWPTMMRTYFRTPWSFLSASSAVILLLLTVAQTVFSILSYLQY